MQLKASRHVRIGNKTFRRGADVVGVTAAKAREFKDKGYLTGDAPDDAPESVPLNKLTVDALKDLAEKHQIDLGDASKKADIVAAIELGREGK